MNHEQPMAQGPVDRKVMRPTDGPWEVVTADRGYIITALDGCYDVAVVRNIGNQNNQANAALIAAAPMMLDAMDRCYRMLLSEPDTKCALFKAENILRETISSAQARTHNVEFSGGAPLFGAASAGTQGYTSGNKENGGE